MTGYFSRQLNFILNGYVKPEIQNKILLRGDSMTSKKNIINILGCIYDFIWHSVENITSISMLLMTIIMAIGVFCRYVLNVSLPWASEIACYFLVFLGIIGGALTLVKGQHITVNIFYDKFSNRIKFLADVIKIILIGFFAYIMVTSGLAYTNTVAKGVFTNIPLGIPRMVVPIGGILIIIFLIVSIMERIFGIKIGNFK